MRAALIATCLTLNGGPLAANDAALDFELADGQRFIRLSTLPPAMTVVNFWRHDCPPCRRELPLLAGYTRGELRVVTIALHRPTDQQVLPDALHAALQPPVIALYGPSQPQGLLRRFGNRQGGLPYTLILDAARKPCTRLLGELTASRLDSALHSCRTGEINKTSPS